MILLRKLLFMDIGAPCRQSGLYTFWATMGAPEEDDNSVKLTKFKKMSSTPELDKYDDEDNNMNDDVDSESDTQGGEEDSSNTGDEGTTERHTESSKIDDRKESVQVAADSAPGVSEAATDGSRDRVVSPTVQDVETVPVVKCVDEAKSVGASVTIKTYSDAVKGVHNRHTTPSKDTKVGPLTDTTTDCSCWPATSCTDESVNIDKGVDCVDNVNIGAKIERESHCHAVCDSLEASHPTETCQSIGVSEGGGPQCDKDTRSDKTCQRDTHVTQPETLTDCHCSDDQDSLHLSDVEDATTTPPLDLSDLLRISEDVLSQGPGKTLNILQQGWACLGVPGSTTTTTTTTSLGDPSQLAVLKSRPEEKPDGDHKELFCTNIELEGHIGHHDNKAPKDTMFNVLLRGGGERRGTVGGGRRGRGRRRGRVGVSVEDEWIWYTLIFTPSDVGGDKRSLGRSIPVLTTAAASVIVKPTAIGILASIFVVFPVTA
ncbi:hypothetical protein Hamer_G022571 [Homarus americanus]|uniref:Uncharacterized protein n=1 Tax=Homarus americanus TaxID=6706 RepID=A0A8J5JI30_HOMAM|nr:hypothetical protein Hamer_G022571 [Homarus americanus]